MTQVVCDICKCIPKEYLAIEIGATPQKTERVDVCKLCADVLALKPGLERHLLVVSLRAIITGRTA